MIRHVWALFLAIALCGCNSIATKPLEPDHASALNGKSIALTQRPSADFTAITAGKAMFGAFGVAAMETAGNAIVEQHGLADPAKRIGEDLVSRLMSAHGMSLVPVADTVRRDRVGDLVTLYSSADYLLDVKTLVWMLNYPPSDWSHYRVTYSAHVRLIDTANRHVIAETTCRVMQGGDADPPSMERLMQHDAALLKQYTEENSVSCLNLIAGKLMELPSEALPLPSH